MWVYVGGFYYRKGHAILLRSGRCWLLGSEVYFYFSFFVVDDILFFFSLHEKVTEVICHRVLCVFRQYQVTLWIYSIKVLCAAVGNLRLKWSRTACENETMHMQLLFMLMFIINFSFILWKSLFISCSCCLLSLRFFSLSLLLLSWSALKVHMHAQNNHHY